MILRRQPPGKIKALHVPNHLVVCTFCRINIRTPSPQAISYLPCSHLLRLVTSIMHGDSLEHSHSCLRQCTAPRHRAKTIHFQHRAYASDVSKPGSEQEWCSAKTRHAVARSLNTPASHETVTEFSASNGTPPVDRKRRYLALALRPSTGMTYSPPLMLPSPHLALSLSLTARNERRILRHSSRRRRRASRSPSAGSRRRERR